MYYYYYYYYCGNIKQQIIKIKILTLANNNTTQTMSPNSQGLKEKGKNQVYPICVERMSGCLYLYVCIGMVIHIVLYKYNIIYKFDYCL